MTGRQGRRVPAGFDPYSPTGRRRDICDEIYEDLNTVVETTDYEDVHMYDYETALNSTLGSVRLDTPDEDWLR